MEKKQYTADVLLFFVAATWGLTFTVIKNALGDISPFTFNSLRFLLAGVFMALISGQRLKNINRKAVISGILIGLFLFGGYSFQTIGLKYTTASNSGFITGLAVVFVPILVTLLTRKLPTLFALTGVIFAGVGLYFLSFEKSFSLNFGDFLTLLSAVFFALHVVAVGKFSPEYDTPSLVTIQILTVAVINGLIALITEPLPGSITTPVWMALLVCAIPATSLAYLIQNWAQKFTTPTRTVIILSMEPVFSALFAFLLLAEQMTARDYAGAALMLAGILIAELKTPGVETERT
ncbi:MAG: hypothetical protein PWQ96_102 [Clostridia bacterium]|nr:hypothetical protein [Clostridia bacterium]